MGRLLLIAGATAVLSCSPAAPRPAALAPAVAAAPAVAPPAERPPLCEVEISGQLRLPAAASPATAPLTFVALGDCLSPDARLLGQAGSTRGRFFIEVFAPWGSDLTLCAASESTPGAPSTLYGKAPGILHAAATGEVEFKDLVVELTPGPPHRFSHQVASR